MFSGVLPLLIFLPPFFLFLALSSSLSLSIFLSFSFLSPLSRRGLNPPHRVKSISMTTFSEDELTLLKDGGNEARTNSQLETSVVHREVAYIWSAHHKRFHHAYI